MALKKKPSSTPQAAEIVNLAVRVPAELRRSLRLYCADKGAELQAVARAALEEYLRKRGVAGAAPRGRASSAPCARRPDDRR